MMHGSMNVKSK